MNFDNGSWCGDPIVNTIQQLIQANVDSGLGLHEIAGDVMDVQLSRVFRRWSSERFQQAEQLRDCMKANDGWEAAASTWLDSWRRIWLSVRTAVNMNNRTMVLRELERAESCVCQIIEAVLPEVRDPLLVDALGRQLNCMREIVDSLRELRTMPAAAIANNCETWSGPLIEDTVVDRIGAAPAELVDR